MVNSVQFLKPYYISTRLKGSRYFNQRTYNKYQKRCFDFNQPSMKRLFTFRDLGVTTSLN